MNHSDKSERITRIERGELLVGWARARLAQKLGGSVAERPSATWCAEPGATFVTLHWPDGRLQGCIGSIEPRCAIVDDVEHNVIAAACYDPRARPVVLGDASRSKTKPPRSRPFVRASMASSSGGKGSEPRFCLRCGRACPA